jgi:hypothetical protein
VNGGDALRRAASFLIGAGVAVLCGSIAWFGFALLTMKMAPELEGADYWRAVGQRAVSNPLLVGLIACFGIGVAAGMALMVRALILRPFSPGGPP